MSDHPVKFDSNPSTCCFTTLFTNQRTNKQIPYQITFTNEVTEEEERKKVEGTEKDISVKVKYEGESLAGEEGKGARHTWQETNTCSIRSQVTEQRRVGWVGIGEVDRQQQQQHHLTN